MKVRSLGFVILLILGLLYLLLPSSVFACENEDGLSACIFRPRPRIALAAAQIPSGTSPTEARDVPNEWQLLAPQASIWYKTDYSNNFRMLEYWLETNRADAASFAVYSPQQSDGLSAATKPIGRGTHNKNDPDTTTRWKAGYAWPGIWYVLLTNHSDQPVSYKLNHNQENVSAKICTSWWEFLGGERILWTDCGRYGPPK